MAKKTLLLGRRIKIQFPNNGGSWGEVVEYDDVKNLYVLLMQFVILKDWDTAAQRLCCKRELLGVACLSWYKDCASCVYLYGSS